MEIKRLFYADFNRWKDDIVKFINETVEINFAGDTVSSCYAENRCKLLNSYLENSSAIVFIATEKDELVGWIWCYKISRFEDTRLHVTEVFTALEYRGQGIGHKLLANVETYAKENNINAVDLLVTASNVDAVDFYSHCGFKTERLQMLRRL